MGGRGEEGDMGGVEGGRNGWRRFVKGGGNEMGVCEGMGGVKGG